MLRELDNTQGVLFISFTACTEAFDMHVVSSKTKGFISVRRVHLFDHWLHCRSAIRLTQILRRNGKAPLNTIVKRTQSMKPLSTRD
jgi:hypothetical protein